MRLGITLSSNMLVLVYLAIRRGYGRRYLDVRRARDLSARSKEGVREGALHLRTLGLVFFRARTPDAQDISISDGAVIPMRWRPDLPGLTRTTPLVDLTTQMTRRRMPRLVLRSAQQNSCRRSTNLRKEDGERATGTYLTDDQSCAGRSCARGDILCRAGHPLRARLPDDLPEPTVVADGGGH